MSQFFVGQKVWNNYENQDRVFRIVEIKGNVALLESDNPIGPKLKDEVYLTDLRPHIPCTNINVIGRSTCSFNLQKK